MEVSLLCKRLAVLYAAIFTRLVTKHQSNLTVFLQAFIEDTNLAKLVHFQGYPHSLLPVTAQGVPSMFICLNTAPELLSQPSLEKQVHISILYFAFSTCCYRCLLWT